MKPLPHEYSVTASATDAGSIRLSAHSLPVLESAAPEEFGGPGDRWSPEELFLAAVADCFVLTFRAISRASKLSWSSLDVTADGVLARVDRVTRFTEITVHARLTGDGLEDQDEKALRLLEKAEKNCLVTNSISTPVTLDASVVSRQAGSGGGG